MGPGQGVPAGPAVLPAGGCTSGEMGGREHLLWARVCTEDGEGEEGRASVSLEGGPGRCVLCELTVTSATSLRATQAANVRRHTENTFFFFLPI